MWINFLLLFTITNKIILGLILLFSRLKYLQDKLLGLIMLLPVATFINDFLFYNKLYNHYTPFLNQIAAHCIAPCIYLYCLRLIGKQGRNAKKQAYLFLSALVPVACWIYYIFGTTEAEKALFLDALVGEHSFFLVELLNGAIELQIVILTAYTYYRIWLFAKKYDYKNPYTNMQLKWSQQVIRLIVALSLFLLISDLIFPTNITEAVVLPILSNIFYWYIIVRSFQNARQYDLLMQVNNCLSERSATKTRKISDAEAGEQVEQIRSYVISTECYLNCEFSLAHLATGLDIPSHKLSALINDHFGLNFSQFINTFRVEAAKARLADPNSRILNFEGIAASCGFGSKASFNRAFKEYTGLTPKEYQKAFCQKPAELIQMLG